MGNLRLSRAAFLVALAAAVWSARPAQGQKLLRWKLKAGDKAALVVTQEIQSKATVQGKPIATRATSTKPQWKPLEGDKPAGP